MLRTITFIAILLITGFESWAHAEPVFNRIASFPVYRNLPEGLQDKVKTSAEIVASNKSGNKLAYSDSLFGAIGFVDISNPFSPQADGLIPLDNDPTSLVWINDHVIVSVNTSQSYSKPSGELLAFEAKSDAGAVAMPKRVCSLPGQPDSIALSHDQGLLAIAIENERDEGVNNGTLPQYPAGSVAFISLTADGLPVCSSLRSISVSHLSKLAPTDPEPEFVTFNSKGELAVTLQENNHIVILDTASGAITSHFSAGTVNLSGIDSERDYAIQFDGNLEMVPREPDAIKWIDHKHLVTANEGDYVGGTRGFTIFSKAGDIVFDTGLSFEYHIAAVGHYPEHRSHKRGIEPEGIAVGKYNDNHYIFISAERASVTGVYKLPKINGLFKPELLQLLPSGISPEGLLQLPSRRLLVVANEKDLLEAGGARSHIMIYQLENKQPTYPQIRSEQLGNQTIPWGALSGMASDNKKASRLYAVSDSAYSGAPSIYTIDTTEHPAMLVDRHLITKNGVVIKQLDLEGIAAVDSGGFWLASEGDHKTDFANRLLQVSKAGEVLQEIALPAYLEKQKKKGGFEGLTTTGSGDSLTLWIAVQRPWKDDKKGQIKMLTYQPATDQWGAVRYPLDDALKGRQVVSALEAHGGYLYVLERDNQTGEEARSKSIYRFKVPTPTLLTDDGFAQPLPLVTKEHVVDLLPAMTTTNGYVQEKLEGFTIDAGGTGWVVSDNDGVDDHSGETLFFSVGKF